ncbi:hypothetical protein [Methanosarcina sp. MTP4]|uniref:hypothetical protein n=1 Tax=Methanosarcina sp. MTP4 TaxID=1434100 RepID=UPI0012E0AF15|nr:hypothetical protein [Methanosarcina sp. MTP4]
MPLEVSKDATNAPGNWTLSSSGAVVLAACSKKQGKHPPGKINNEGMNPADHTRQITDRVSSKSE